MLARVCSAAVNGIEAYPVEVEVNVGYGDTLVVIVGLPDAAVKESRDRVSTALINSAYKFPMDKTTGLRFDQTVVATGLGTQFDYPAPIRRIGYRDPQTGKALVFLANNFTVPALIITQLYRGRWQIELFFKWLKQPLRIKAFYGTSPNAVRTQIWSAIAVYLLVAILKKRLHLDASLYTILQILSLTLVEKTPISQVLAQLSLQAPPSHPQNHQCSLGF